MIEEFIKTIVLTGMGIQKKALETVEEIITHRSPGSSSSHEQMADDFVKEARDTGKETDKSNELIEKIEALQNDFKKLKDRISSQEKRISKLEKNLTRTIHKLD